VLIFLLIMLGVAGVALGVYTAIDASRYPEWAFERAGTSKNTWVVLPIVLALFLGVGALAMGIVWLASKKLDVATIALTFPPEWGGPRPPHPPRPPRGSRGPRR
jgi:hypothetical protein